MQKKFFIASALLIGCLAVSGSGEQKDSHAPTAPSVSRAFDLSDNYILIEFISRTATMAALCGMDDLAGIGAKAASGAAVATGLSVFFFQRQPEAASPLRSVTKSNFLMGGVKTHYRAASTRNSARWASESGHGIGAQNSGSARPCSSIRWSSALRPPSLTLHDSAT